MKIRSRNLYLFLVEKEVLDKDGQAIADAKAEYRRIYKRNWKKNILVKKKELRPAFTPKEYTGIRLKALELGLTPTGFIQKTALESIQQATLIPQREKLLKILVVYQFIGV